MNVKVLSGDICQVNSGAIIAAINSGGAWFGGVDGAIQRAAGNYFHNQAANAMPLKDLDVILAKGRKGGGLCFDNVIFVVDDMRSKLRNVIFKGLEAAHKNGIEQVSLPAIRTGVMKGVVEKSLDEVSQEVAEGMKMFTMEYPESTLDITFVIYSDKAYEKSLQNNTQKLIT